MLLKQGKFILRHPKVRAKGQQQDILILVPTIKEYINGFFDHETKQRISNMPEHQIRKFIRYFFLDWIPNRDWIFSEKITERNRELMKQGIGNYRRKLLILYDVVLGKSVHDKMPWELTIRSELLLEE